MAEASLMHTLAWHHNKDTGQCNPGADRLRKETGMSNDTLWKVIKSVEAKGLLSHVSGGVGRPNRYRLLLDGVKQEGGPTGKQEATLDEDLVLEAEPLVDDDDINPDNEVDISSARRLCQKVYRAADKPTVIPTKKDEEQLAAKLRERPAGEVESVIDFVSGHPGFKKSLLAYKGVPVNYPVSFFLSTMYESYYKAMNYAHTRQR
jgi:Helix-turn-helix domain